MHYHIRGAKLLYNEEPYFYIKHPLGPFKITAEGKLIKVSRIPAGYKFTHSSHIDFRIDYGDYLVGWTLATGNTGDDMLKIISATDKKKMIAIAKAPEPTTWISVTTPKKPIFITPRGHVGATANTEGVFVHLDNGILYPGALKPTFVEYFIKGNIIKGRYVFRSVLLDVINPETNKKAGKQNVFLFWKSKDQSPYMLSSRAKRKGFIPPKGIVPIAPEHIDQYPDKLYKTLVWLLGEWS